MNAVFIALLLILIPYQSTDQVSDVEKQKFIELLKSLPTKGEFYTDEAVKKAGHFLPTLFALTEKDIEKYDSYPFAAISRGLCEFKEHRDYAVHHFAEIRHPKLKLLWGAMLFDAGATSPEIVRFLRDALESEAQSKTLSEIVGPQFKNFKARVLAYH
jgi:hypothetical protein